MNTLTRRKKKLRSLATFVFLVLAYVGVAKLGLRLALVQMNATAVWAPTGIAIAVFLFLGNRTWPAIFLGALITNFTTPGTTILGAIGIAIGNTLEGLLAAYLVKRFANGLRAFNDPIDVFKYGLFAGVMGPAASATLGVVSLALTGSASWSNFAVTWTTWWLGDLGGAVVIAPFLILWFSKEYKSTGRVRDPWSVFLLAAILSIFSLLIFENETIFLYLFFPILIWVVFDFGKREASTVVLVLAEVSLWATLRGLGPFFYQGGGVLNNALLLLDGAMASASVTMLALAAAVEENRLARAKLTQEKVAEEVALANVASGVIITDHDAEVVMVNRAAENMLGFSRDELVGRRFTDIIVMQEKDGTPIELADRPLELAIASGDKITNDSFPVQKYYRRKDGSTFPIAYTATPVIVEGNIIGAIELFQDVSAEMKGDETRMDIISTIAHQLRTPLSVIGLSSELLRGQGTLFGRRVNNGESVESYTQDIQMATKQMVDIVNDLLNMSRIESKSILVTPEPVQIEAVLRRIVDGVSPVVKSKKQKISLRVTKDIDEVTTDPAIFKVIMQNLISNAVKYTPEEGSVWVSAVRAVNQVVVIVSDTGYGIPREDQEKVFEKFYRGKNAADAHASGGGTGLGLYITKAMVEALEGEISFVSEEGEGSTFIVRLPLKR